MAAAVVPQGSIESNISLECASKSPFDKRPIHAQQETRLRFARPKHDSNSDQKPLSPRSASRKHGPEIRKQLCVPNMIRISKNRKKRPEKKSLLSLVSCPPSPSSSSRRRRPQMPRKVELLAAVSLQHIRSKYSTKERYLPGQDFRHSLLRGERRLCLGSKLTLLLFAPPLLCFRGSPQSVRGVYVA